QMLRDFPEAVVVMMTAYGAEQVAAQALRGCADDYTAKPIDLHRLRELLERNLEKQRLRAERQSLVARLKDSNRYLMRQHAALRRADEEILQVNRQLEQSSRYKSEFLANMSHELRTPLNAIMGFSEILLDLTMNLTAGERTEFLRNIHSSGQHLLGLINDILDLAKIEAGKMDLHPEEMPVMEALQEITAILDPMARPQGLQPRTAGAADHGGRIWAESQFGKGSIFTFTIPRERRPAAVTPVEEAAPTLETMELPLALVIEDDPASSQRMTAEIQGVGFRVAHAFDGEQAVRKAMEILPDLLVMETVLPVKDGWQVLQELRARAATADVPVLGCSVPRT